MAKPAVTKHRHEFQQWSGKREQLNITETSVS